MLFNTFGSKKVLLQGSKNTPTYFGKLSDKTLELIKSMYDINDIEKPLFESHKNTYARHLQKALNFLFNKNFKVDRKQKVVQHSLIHTFATAVLNNGAELNTVHHLLNHRSLRQVCAIQK
ncbi:MAG: tyrosine-type recombinase/integrase [Campylobacteraceae bacterium]|nr:tyrosine-type recombinase/integrase [Campylobacteraceae bacterium]